MTWTTSTRSLAGYEGSGTISISYSLPSGRQGPEHANPGAPFAGTSRAAYLPDNSDGRHVLHLLDTCFKRRHTFTIGTSLTTGQANCVVKIAILYLCLVCVCVCVCSLSSV